MIERIGIASYGFVMYWVHFFWPVNLNAFYPYPHVNGVFVMPWYYWVMCVVPVMICVAMIRRFAFGVGARRSLARKSGDQSVESSSTQTPSPRRRPGPIRVDDMQQQWIPASAGMTAPAGETPSRRDNDAGETPSRRDDDAGETPSRPYVSRPYVSRPYVSRPYVSRLSSLGLSWYTLTIILVLQIISVGQVIMADRYTYIPMIGMLLVVLSGIAYLVHRWKGATLAVVTVFTFAQGILTYRQVGMWHDTETIWTSILDRSGNMGGQPERLRKNLSDGYLPIYLYRGIHYFETGNAQASYDDLRVLLQYPSPRTDAYERLGLLAGMMGKIDESITAYTSAINLGDASADAYLNRGIGYLRTGRPAEAQTDFETGLTRNPLPETEIRLRKGLRTDY